MIFPKNWQTAVECDLPYTLLKLEYIMVAQFSISNYLHIIYLRKDLISTYVYLYNITWGITCSYSYKIGINEIHSYNSYFINMWAFIPFDEKVLLLHDFCCINENFHSSHRLFPPSWIHTVRPATSTLLVNFNEDYLSFETDFCSMKWYIPLLFGT